MTTPRLCANALSAGARVLYWTFAGFEDWVAREMVASAHALAWVPGTRAPTRSHKIATGGGLFILEGTTRLGCDQWVTAGGRCATPAAVRSSERTHGPPRATPSPISELVQK